jgi:peptidoglycan/xylan/chitin deacetylase (PgdA/CDA1 family)
MADRSPGPDRPYRPPALLLGSLALHAAGAVALAAAPRHWRTVAGVLFADHLTLTAASLWPRGQWVGLNLLRLPAASGRRGEVSLTFDDGPDPEVTPRVLDLLDGAGMRATFFVIGRRARAYPALAAEIARRGHRVENHTDTHPHLFACYTAGLLRREVEGAQKTIEAATGRRPRLFRAPAGLRNPLLDLVLHRAGLRLVAWTRRGFDAVERDAAAIARRLLGGLAPGDILLLHDGRAHGPRGGNPVVLEVLPRVLDALAARGLRSVPVPALPEAME